MFVVGVEFIRPGYSSFFNGFDESNPYLDKRDASSTGLYILLKIKMVICNDISYLFFVIGNNISYNKLEVEKKILKKRRIFKKVYRIQYYIK